MKVVWFHPDAEAEMVDAAAYYETQQHRLGQRFLASVQDAINRIQINPLLYPAVEMNVRCCQTKTFPYAVLFVDFDNQLAVIAVMHLHRDPNYWRVRTKEI